MSYFNVRPGVSYEEKPRHVKIVYDGCELDGVRSINVTHSVDLPSQSMAQVELDMYVQNVRVENEGDTVTYYLTPFNPSDKVERLLKAGGYRKKGTEFVKKEE